MFTTKFQHASSSPLPPTVDLQNGLAILHDFPVVIRLSPDCRGCKPIAAPQAKQAKKEQAKANGDSTPTSGTSTPTVVTNGNAGGGGALDGVGDILQTEGSTKLGEMSHYEVEDDLPFIPKRLWSGGVRYLADFVPVADGCDITVHAPGGFTSTNHWRLVREVIPETATTTTTTTVPATQPPPPPVLERTVTKDLLHAETTGGGWYVQIVSDAQCNRTFAGFVKGFLKNSHQQLQTAFIERLKVAPAQQRSRRPTLGRRRSSVF